MSRDLIIGLLALALVMTIVVSVRVSNYNECKTHGFSTFYCMTQR